MPTERSDEPTSSIAASVDGDVISEPIAEATVTENDRGGVVEEVHSSHADDHEVESVGAEDALEEIRSRRKPVRRNYKIQEVIKRRQILLVQVVKEERGNKGAALTTYLSLAGRYSVLMPNTARGGGISRKITNAQDRKRLKEVVQDLDVPQGMGVILRTAGESRTKAEIKRDYEYLMRLWENVRNLTLQSTAPALVYEEGSLIKRSVRDLYNKDIDEILVAGEDGYREAKDFMRMLMPSHAKVVQPFRDTRPDLRPQRHRGAARQDAAAAGDAEVRRLHHHQPDRGAGFDRRQLRPLHQGAFDRGHGAPDQSGGVRGSQPPAPAARPRRPDRHRLHRHGGEPQQPGGREAAQGLPEERPRPHPGRPHLAFRPAGNVAPAHPRQRAGIDHEAVPALRRRRPCPLRFVGRAACRAGDRGIPAQGFAQPHHGEDADRDRALRAQPQAQQRWSSWSGGSA